MNGADFFRSWMTTVALVLCLRFLGFAEEITMVRSESGTFEIPVVINQVVKLNFMVDSGASDVTIPEEVALTLIRSKTLDISDFLPGQVYQLADGSQVHSECFTIRSIRVGNIEFHNVRGAIARAGGPLLLGQSFLNRLHSWTQNNQSGKFIAELGDGGGSIAPSGSPWLFVGEDDAGIRLYYDRASIRRDPNEPGSALVEIRFYSPKPKDFKLATAQFYTDGTVCIFGYVGGVFLRTKRGPVGEPSDVEAILYKIVLSELHLKEN